VWANGGTRCLIDRRIDVRLLSEGALAELIDVAQMISWTEEAFLAFSTGHANVPLRSELLRDSPNGVLFAMPAMVGTDSIGVKVVGSVERPDQVERATTCLMLIWDATTLVPLGLLSADTFNEHRTAAALAAATRALARPNSANHTIFGAGKLAFASALYISNVCPIRRLFIVSRTADRVEKLAERLRKNPRFAGLEVITGVDRDEAAQAADVITTLTTSATPVFDGKTVRSGTHINLGGAFRPDMREMDDTVAAKAGFWLDHRESCTRRAGDVVQPLQSGVLTEDRVYGEIGAVFSGAAPGRHSEQEITVFKSLGVAAQDVFLGRRLLEQAERSGKGTIFEERDA
jgi:ornithine cyclodeaminase